MKSRSACGLVFEGARDAGAARGHDPRACAVELTLPLENNDFVTLL